MGSKSKSTQTTTNKAAIDRYNQASATLPQAYRALTGDQINQYMNPYQSGVIDTTLADLNRSREMGLNAANDRAIKAGAFGGTGASVERALAQGEFDRNTAGVLANLNAQNYSQAMQTAQQQNASMNQYPLAYQALLGQLAQGTQTTTTGTQSQSPGLAQILQAAGTAAQGAAMFSDVRLKRDIKPLGERNGRKWYEFKYLWSDDVHEGVMAQENPDIAIMHPSGFLMVDYGGLA